MNFHRNYALRGFFGGDKDSDEGEIDLPENAKLYYVGTAKSVLDSTNLHFESDATGTLQEE